MVMPALLGVVFARGFRVSLLQPDVGLVTKSILHIRNQHLNEMKWLAQSYATTTRQNEDSHPRLLLDPEVLPIAL